MRELRIYQKISSRMKNMCIQLCTKTLENVKDQRRDRTVRNRGKVLDCFHDEWAFTLHVRRY